MAFRFDQKTVNVLKNFSYINQNLLVKPGNVLSTISPSRSIFAKAKIDQRFDSSFFIYDVSRFLGVLSLFGESPEAEINQHSIIIKDSSSAEVEYRLADPSILAPNSLPPEKEITLPSTDAEFFISTINFSNIQKALNILNMPEIMFEGKDGKIWLRVFDGKNEKSDGYRIHIGQTKNKFRFVIKSENLKFITQNYNVKISSKGLAHFHGDDSVNIDYWVALEAKHSKFETE